MAINGFRARLTSFFFGKRKNAEGREVPVIMTEYGPVSEQARLQAALNMRGSAEIRARVEGSLVKQFGSVARGLAEARRRYPEAYE